MTDSDFRYERFSKHMPRVSDPVLAVLKGHLLVEEILDELIRYRCSAPEVLKGVELTFFAKSRIARALVGGQLENGLRLPDRVWPMIDALNELRNDLAHKLESEKLPKRMRRFIESAAFEPEEGESENDLASNLDGAIAYLLGFLSSMENLLKNPDLVLQR